jgi:hypothetical protein
MNVFIPCLDFTELSPLQKQQFLIGDTCYYFNQEQGRGGTRRPPPLKMKKYDFIGVKS